MKTPPHIRCIRLQRRKGGIPKIAGVSGRIITKSASEEEDCGPAASNIRLRV